MSYEYDFDKTMWENELKKMLYKEKPIANRVEQAPHAHLYTCKLSNGYTAKFTVPIADMGETTFLNDMPAQLLIRYLEL